MFEQKPLERFFQEAVPFEKDEAHSKRLAKKKLEELLTLGGTDRRYPYTFKAGHTIYTTHTVDGKKYMQIAAVVSSPAFTPSNFADYVLGRPINNPQPIIDSFLTDYSKVYPAWQFLTTAQ